MSRTLYTVVCRDCREEYTTYCSFNDLQTLLMKEKCTSCRGELRQSFLGGGAYQMKTGATRTPT